MTLSPTEEVAVSRQRPGVWYGGRAKPAAGTSHCNECPPSPNSLSKTPTSFSSTSEIAIFSLELGRVNHGTACNSPGDQFAEELRALELSTAEFARQLRVPTARVTGILNGQRANTGDAALGLGSSSAPAPDSCSSRAESREDYQCFAHAEAPERWGRKSAGSRMTALRGCGRIQNLWKTWHKQHA